MDPLPRGARRARGGGAAAFGFGRCHCPAAAARPSRLGRARDAAGRHAAPAAAPRPPGGCPVASRMPSRGTCRPPKRLPTRGRPQAAAPAAAPGPRLRQTIRPPTDRTGPTAAGGPLVRPAQRRTAPLAASATRPSRSARSRRRPSWSIGSCPTIRPRPERSHRGSGHPRGRPRRAERSSGLIRVIRSVRCSSRRRRGRPPVALPAGSHRDGTRPRGDGDPRPLRPTLKEI